ncbi:MAG: class I SAM-dependent methyltransferase [candidate division KSB1 bacterium]|nr:class I SAM-dependent methyltransferase [candidate division KSB1 bacterium]MDZ7345321.1 class I SAM-dependent methyltransferase [candidate division KSB1 bacterium]
MHWDDGGQLKIETAPYSVLALIYDQVMSHVDYALWARYIEQLLNKYCPKARQIIDLSCGTGTCCGHLCRLGFQVVGMDASLAMIKRAREKYRGTKINSVFFCGNILFPPFKNSQVMISLYDSMNYLMTEIHWRTCLANIHRALAENGLFIFDVSTLYNSRRYFRNYEEVRSFKGGSYRRISRFSEEDCVQMNDFEIRIEGRRETFIERHRQMIRPLGEIKKWVLESGFQLMAAYRDFTFVNAGERCERVHFVLRRRS